VPERLLVDYYVIFPLHA